MKIILLLLVVFFCSQVMMTFVKRDVCILGSGASGMSSAVFLKDRGYKNVLVIEKDDKIGGHCDSSYFTPPSPGQQDWLELGVVVFPDTAKENATGIGKWTLGSREFAQRFLPPNGTFPYGGFVPSYGFDFNRRFSVGLLPNNPPTQEYIDAYIRFNTILATQYPWIENANIPDPIPPVLLKPFGEFITANNLSAINSLFYSLLYFGGMGNFKTVTTLYALQNLRRGVTTIYSDPSYGFAIKGGCLKMYNGMANYIGTNNIVTGATVLTVNRAIPNNIIVVYKKGFLVKTEICEKLIVSFPQLLNRMGFIDLNQEETSIFQKVEANYYYNYRIEAQGPITQNSPFNLVSLDIVDPDQIPPFPNILVLRRELAYGPTSGFAYALTDIPESQMYNIVNQYLGYIPSSYLTNISISWFDQHLYQAHFPVSALSQSPTPYTKLKNLQGKRGTYWTGALFSFAETASIWQKTYDLITQNFPKKN